MCTLLAKSYHHSYECDLSIGRAPDLLGLIAGDCEFRGSLGKHGYDAIYPVLGPAQKR